VVNDAAGAAPHGVLGPADPSVGVARPLLSIGGMACRT
jgi:hypothetical protein